MKQFKFESKHDELEYYFDIRIEYLEEQLKLKKNPFIHKAKIKLARIIKQDVLAIMNK